MTATRSRARKRMRRTTLQAVGVLITAMAMTLVALPVQAGGALCQGQRVLHADPEQVAGAVETLRRFGPRAVPALIEAIESDETLAANPARWSDRLDAVCAMKDCADARLFWYTDLDAALEQAQATGRPVLSLRLLGRLDEELSCANSRLFRLALYTHPQISRVLRDGWVLHWHTVREVPTVSIRFGPDRAGPERFLEGTVTGNSIHYVLDIQGRIVDALPGLYGPGAFLDALTVARLRAVEAGAEPDSRFVVAQARYHEGRARATWRALGHDLKRLGVEQPAEVARELTRGAGPTGSRVSVRSPSARDAVPRAMTKAVIETEVVDAIVLDAVALDPGRAGSAAADLDWPAIGTLHPEWNGPIPVNVEALRRRLPAGADLGVALGTLERLFLADTAQNEYSLRPVLRRWLGSSAPQRDLEAFDERVYADLFLTPLSDPWLGLSPENLYTALRPVRADPTGHAGMNPDAK